jgi:hypothetical protein
VLCIFLMVCDSWDQVHFFLFGASVARPEIDMRFCSQKLGQLTSLEVPFVESWKSFFFLLTSVIGCMENIWNIFAGHLSLAICDKHSVAGMSAKPSLDSD